MCHKKMCHKKNCLKKVCDEKTVWFASKIHNQFPFRNNSTTPARVMLIIWSQTKNPAH